MRIALVVNSFPSLSETFIYNHAAGLRAAGLDVTVVAARAGDDPKLFADFDGLRYDGPIRLAALSSNKLVTLRRVAELLTGETARGIALWNAARRRYGTSRRAIRAWLLALPLADFDLIHLEYSELAVAYRDALPLLAPAKLVVSCRGAAEQITPLVDPRRGELLREVFAAVDRVHCVSNDMLATCTEYGLDRAKSFVNRPAIDARRFVRSAPYAPRTRGYRLLSTGRLHWKKSVETALVAVRALLDRGLDVHYEIIGGGKDEERLRFTTHDLRLDAHVTFAGKQSSTEVRAALERCDVYLLPSVSEGLSNAALEAMAMGVPLVTTTAGGMAEAVTDGVDGMIVPPRDPLAMADRIATLLADPARRVAMGIAARAKIEREFTLDRQIREFVAQYALIMDGDR